LTGGGGGRGGDHPGAQRLTNHEDHAPAVTHHANGLDALARRVSDARIDREERKGKGASDHAPVVVELGD
jgi:hypothetical protein